MTNKTIPFSIYADSLEYCLAFHCAPVIEGVKISNLISLKQVRCACPNGECQLTKTGLCCRGISFFKLQEHGGRTLFLVYREDLMRRYFLKPQVAAFLQSCGYDVHKMELANMLALLANRIGSWKSGQEYPHEIGIFLGYPVEDIKGFIRHGGEGFHLSGYWKVYSNPARAKKVFQLYDTVRDAYCSRVYRGEKIINISLGGITNEQNFGGLLVGNR